MEEQLDFVLGRVSVIVPAYNAAETLERCVRSVLSQTYSLIELILVDDGSIDATPEICNDIMESGSCVRTIHKENGGLSSARNAGIEASTGEFLFFLDADDYIEPNEIEELYRALELEGADIAVGGFRYVDESGCELDRLVDKHAVYEEETYWNRAYYGAFDSYGEFVVAWGKLYRRSVFEHERFDVGKIHEDEYIIHRLVKTCRSIVIVESDYLAYVQRDGSIMHNLSIDSHLDLAEALYKRSNYFLSRGWRDLSSTALFFSWNSLLGARARHKSFDKGQSERFDMLCDCIRSQLSLYEAKRRCSVSQYLKVMLFKGSPDLYSHVADFAAALIRVKRSMTNIRLIRQ